MVLRKSNSFEYFYAPSSMQVVVLVVVAAGIVAGVTVSSKINIPENHCVDPYIRMYYK